MIELTDTNSKAITVASIVTFMFLVTNAGLLCYMIMTLNKLTREPVLSSKAAEEIKGAIIPTIKNTINNPSVQAIIRSGGNANKKYVPSELSSLINKLKGYEDILSNFKTQDERTSSLFENFALTMDGAFNNLNAFIGETLGRIEANIKRKVELSAATTNVSVENISNGITELSSVVTSSNGLISDVGVKVESFSKEIDEVKDRTIRIQSNIPKIEVKMMELGNNFNDKQRQALEQYSEKFSITNAILNNQISIIAEATDEIKATGSKVDRVMLSTDAGFNEVKAEILTRLTGSNVAKNGIKGSDRPPSNSVNHNDAYSIFKNLLASEEIKVNLSNSAINDIRAISDTHQVRTSIKVQEAINRKSNEIIAKVEESKVDQEKVSSISDQVSNLIEVIPVIQRIDSRVTNRVPEIMEALQQNNQKVDNAFRRFSELYVFGAEFKADIEEIAEFSSGTNAYSLEVHDYITNHMDDNLEAVAEKNFEYAEVTVGAFNEVSSLVNDLKAILLTVGGAVSDVKETSKKTSYVNDQLMISMNQLLLSEIISGEQYYEWNKENNSVDKIGQPPNYLRFSSFVDGREDDSSFNRQIPFYDKVELGTELTRPQLWLRNHLSLVMKARNIESVLLTLDEVGVNTEAKLSVLVSSMLINSVEDFKKELAPVIENSPGFPKLMELYKDLCGSLNEYLRPGRSYMEVDDFKIRLQKSVDAPPVFEGTEVDQESATSMNVDGNLRSELEGLNDDSREPFQELDMLNSNQHSMVRPPSRSAFEEQKVSQNEERSPLPNNLERRGRNVWSKRLHVDINSPSGQPQRTHRTLNDMSASSLKGRESTPRRVYGREDVNSRSLFDGRVYTLEEERNGNARTSRQGQKKKTVRKKTNFVEENKRNIGRPDANSYKSSYDSRRRDANKENRR